MRFVSFIWVVVFGLFYSQASSETIAVTDEHLRPEFLSEAFADLLIHRVMEKWPLLQLRPFGKGARYPVLPPNLTIPLDSYMLQFDSDLAQGYYQQYDSLLEFALQDGVSVVDSNSTSITMQYELNASEVAQRGSYMTNVGVNFTFVSETFPDIPDMGIVPVTGSGWYKVALRNISFLVTIEVGLKDDVVESVNTKFQHHSLNGLSIYFNNFYLNEELVEDTLWETWGQVLAPILDYSLNGFYPVLEPLLDVVLEELLKPCTPTDIIEGNVPCLPEPTTTEGPLEPPTTPGPGPDPGQCSETKPCPAGSFCEEQYFGGPSYCACSDQLYSVPTHEQDAPCARIVGASCILSTADPEYVSCAQNSVCVASNATHGRCECNTGFIGTQRGTCAADYGQSCSGSGEYGIKCFDEFTLACRFGRCVCASPDLVFEAGRGCVAPAGEPCNVHSDIEHPHRVQCATGLECVQLRVGRHVCQSSSDFTKVLKSR